MNYTEFKSILSKSKRKMIVVGVFVTLVGIPFLLANFLDQSKIVYWIFAAIFLALGLFMIVKPMSDLGKINSDQLPLLKAIKNQQRDYVIWVYQKVITSEVDGIKAGKTNNVVIYTNSNKMEEILLGKKGNVDGVIAYLSAEFPGALVGYSTETREAAGKILKKK
ncbi:MAG: hypothetical protein HYZ14_17320 [Bacteroidetes bacterium]|nr:hypothetical protein [Bacteroidota bacterium]